MLAPPIRTAPVNPGTFTEAAAPSRFWLEPTRGLVVHRKAFEWVLNEGVDNRNCKGSRFTRTQYQQYR